jgi:hypothetical protein
MDSSLIRIIEFTTEFSYVLLYKSMALALPSAVTIALSFSFSVWMGRDGTP